MTKRIRPDHKDCAICGVQMTISSLGRERVYCSDRCKWRSRPAGPPRLTAVQRWHSKYEIQPSGCWLWMAGDVENCYGLFYHEGTTKIAHRVGYELLVGPIPEGLVLDHLCRVRRCVNPAHLEPVTQSENMVRSNNYERSVTHCPLDHPYDEENTYFARGKRACRTCQRLRLRKPNGYVAKRKAKCQCTCCDH